MEGSGVTIPQDIMAIARTVADRDVNFGSYEVNTLAIARAILAERQRCADVAGSYGTIPGYPDGKTGAFRKHRHRIRQAILAGETA